jgi:hypothetical protein
LSDISDRAQQELGDAPPHVLAAYRVMADHLAAAPQDDPFCNAVATILEYLAQIITLHPAASAVVPLRAVPAESNREHDKLPNMYTGKLQG